MELVLHPLAVFRPMRTPSAKKMWLTVSTKIPYGDNELTLRGYVPGSLLGTEAQWARFSTDRKNEVEHTVACEVGHDLSSALADAARAAELYLAACLAESLTPNIRKLKDSWSAGDVDLLKLPAQLDTSLADMRTTARRKLITAEIAEKVKLADYPAMFPAIRTPRKFVAVLGPTNSGKTYDAFLRLAEAASGVVLGPLRLLALEAFSRLNSEFGVITSLVTGEERRLVPSSTVTASTIEMLTPGRKVEVAIIDEVQMISDPARGWAWTQAIVGADADEVWMLGALSAEPAIRALAERLNIPVEFRYKERKHPLRVSDSPLGATPYGALQNVQPGDALIVFSRRDALNLRDDLLALGKSVACVYGSLSPEVREREASRFMAGEADVLIGTDALGLGLNLPIQRIIFTSVTKFDGNEVAELTVPLCQQVGGRAGRYGHQQEPGVVMGLTSAEHEVVVRLMKAKQPPCPVSMYPVAPNFDYLMQLAHMSGDNRLEALLSLFLLHTDAGDNFFVPFVPEEQLTRARYLDTLDALGLEEKYVCSMAPMDSADDDLAEQWTKWVGALNQGHEVCIDFLPESVFLASLATAEQAVHLLTAYRWFAYRLPYTFVEGERAVELTEVWASIVDEHLRSSRKQGQGGGRAGLPSWYWGPKRSAR